MCCRERNVAEEMEMQCGCFRTPHVGGGTEWRKKNDEQHNKERRERLHLCTGSIIAQNTVEQMEGTAQ